MTAKERESIALRWDGVTKGYVKLSFDEAHADMQALLSELRTVDDLRRRILGLEEQVRRRNNAMLEFASEVERLARQKYADFAAPQQSEEAQ